MQFLNKEIEEKIRNTDIVSVISRYVNLEKNGKWHIGNCPFHNEPGTLIVDSEKSIWFCYTCGKSGNAITFLMEYLKIDFISAVKYLIEDFTENNMEPFSTFEARKELIFIANREAADFYHKKLCNSENVGFKYFKKRCLSENTINKFNLGYAEGNGTLVKYMFSRGFTTDILLEAGLVREYDGKLMDNFWKRVIFPITDKKDRIIGFGGRILDEGKPKYLNTNETIVYNKKRNLFGLSKCRKSDLNNMIICEGYMDVITMHQYGFDNTVASLGTALTEEQCDILASMTDTVILAYDMDEAGIKAMSRAAGMLQKRNVSLKVLDLSPCKDPDEFLKKFGAEEMRKRIAISEYIESQKVKSSHLNIDAKLLAKSAFVQENDELTNNNIVKLSYKFMIPMTEIKKETNWLKARYITR